MTTYTLVSYKEDYRDSRRDDYYSSAWDINVFENQEDIVDAVFDIKVKVKVSLETGARDNESNWEYVILIDGRRADDWTDDQDNEDPRFWEIEGKARSLFEEWLLRANERKEVARIAEEEKKRKALEASKIEKTKREKALLKQLQEKYPNG